MDKIYRLVVCTKFEGKKGFTGWFDFGTKREVGLFDNKEDCISILKNNTADICETIYDFAYIEEVFKNALYPMNGRLDIYKAENTTINKDGKQYYNFNLNYVLIHTEKSIFDDLPVVIKTWEELSECQSETHVLKIDTENGSGWIYNKEDDEDRHYLSTHSFYGSNYKASSLILQKCGFDVQLANWDSL